MHTEIAARVRTYFQRQIAWLESRLDELDHLDSLLDDDHLEALTAAEQRRERELENFQREAEGLLREWQTNTTATEAERKEVRALTSEARTLANQLMLRCQSAAETAHGERGKCEGEINALRRARGAMRKYRPGEEADEGRIDRRG
jgi:predicted  nucleic acid-binding Zn-ribbon protein